MIYLKSDFIALYILVSIQSCCGIFYNVNCYNVYRARKVQERSFRITGVNQTISRLVALQSHVALRQMRICMSLQWKGRVAVVDIYKGM